MPPRGPWTVVVAVTSTRRSSAPGARHAAEAQARRRRHWRPYLAALVAVLGGAPTNGHTALMIETAVPQVFMDEAGNTGGNLLDAAQPIYALAAVRVNEDARRAITAALARTQMNELKFQRLRTSSAGRHSILKLLDEVELRPGTAAVMVAHKPWMLAAKLVDELIEPRMLAKGIQMAWYASGSAKSMAHALFTVAPDALGDVYPELQAAFVVLLRDYSEEKGAAFLSSLRRARIVCSNEQMHELLSVMIDTPAEIRDEFANRQDALDPGLTSLHCQAGHWSSLLAERFEIVHDDSNTVRRWAEELEVIAGARGRTGEPPRPQSLVVGEIEMPLPTMLQSISFVTSERDERVQLADVVAGAAAHVFGVCSDRRVRELLRATPCFTEVAPGHWQVGCAADGPAVIEP